MSDVYDLIIIGSGPGGYKAAYRAGILGLKTALIEKNNALGGTCLHRGCIPTKALLHVSDLYYKSKNMKQFGIIIDNPKINWELVQKYKNKIINTNAIAVSQLLKSKKIDIFFGFASFLNKNLLNIKHNKENFQLKAKNIIISVGSKPKEMILAPLNSFRILNSDSIHNLKKIPASLIIIGGGIIGVEFASIFTKLGTKVTILESLNNIINIADHECSMELERELVKQGVIIQTKVKINSIKSSDSNITINFKDQNKEHHEINSDYLLISIGRTPSINGLNLKDININTKNNFIEVNDNLQSNYNNIYAVGDCIKTQSLAHVASYEAVNAVNHIANKEYKKINYNHIPSCIYTEPNIAWCGLTESEATNQGYEIKIKKFNFARNAKAAILGKRNGFIKVIIDEKYEEILGIHIVGSQATELISEPAFAMQIEATMKDIASSMHAHPTLYESFHDLANDLVDCK